MMKFMITWQFHPGKLQEGLSQFSRMATEQEAPGMGKDIKMIGRWHDLARGRGVAVFESEDDEAVSNWALNWNGMMDIDISIVLDDEETRALGKARS
jgi:hypothetical protein